MTVRPDVDEPTGYILCATPRTGSTFLCSLLASTGLLGRPESYFREPDEVAWASRFGLATVGQRVQSYESFLAAVRDAGTTENGVFGTRVMWGSLQRLVEGIGRPPQGSDTTTLRAALGPLAFVHLVREDVVGQAVSWARAEQSGYWQPGDVVRPAGAPDVARMVALVETIQDHNAAWQTWFATNGIRPRVLTYEALTSVPETAVRAIADLTGVTIPSAWRPVFEHHKQADEVNADWSELLRSALGYDAVAQDYAILIPDLSAETALDVAMIDDFAQRCLDARLGPVADLGCGTGRISDHLAARGVDVFGVDFSAGMIEVARQRHPQIRFDVGSMEALPVQDNTLGGALAWYSLIHTRPDLLPTIANEFARVMRTGAWLLTAFQAGDGERSERASSYGHPVAMTNHRHVPQHVVDVLDASGFDVHTRLQRAPEGNESTPQVVLLARRRLD